MQPKKLAPWRQYITNNRNLKGMKANELRIGNYVIYEIDDMILVAAIDVINPTFCNIEFVDVIPDDLSRYQDGMWYEYIKPIPLTEEWLLKFGFYKEENVTPVSKYHSHFYSIGYDDCKYSFAYASFRDDWGFYHSYTDAVDEKDNNRFDAISFGIQSVHELQNLYFALTGEELTLKLHP
jgi:hypothetical protein